MAVTTKGGCLSCHLHPEVEAATTCVGCAEAFCVSCFITIGGQDYCAVCKTMAVSPGMVPATGTCREARDALCDELQRIERRHDGELTGFSCCSTSRYVACAPRCREQRKQAGENA